MKTVESINALFPMNKKARALLLDILRNPYCWPGGYEKLLLTQDGALLCSACCKKEARRIMSDIRDSFNTGWLPEAATYEAVSPECTKEMAGEDYLSNCSHCHKIVGELGA